MRKKLSKAEISQLDNLQYQLDKIRKEIEENEVQLNYGNGTASEQISCAVASLECILQEYY